MKSQNLEYIYISLLRPTLNHRRMREKFYGGRAEIARKHLLHKNMHMIR